jgi:hypothetical protein
MPAHRQENPDALLELRGQASGVRAEFFILCFKSFSEV